MCSYSKRVSPEYHPTLKEKKKLTLGTYNHLNKRTQIQPHVRFGLMNIEEKMLCAFVRAMKNNVPATTTKYVHMYKQITITKWFLDKL